ncbi:hypothetical protein ACFCXA_03510 [Streptomyces virginiae]|uniref:hypothetical protein n=1 Tax=Streptomyces virginiae TaxID=1961 RepID=UPI0035E32F2D
MNPSSTTRSRRRGTYLGLATILGLALSAGSLYVLFYGAGGSCEEARAAERMAQVSTAAPAAPVGATPVAERTGVECMDDSGDPWVAADSGYTHDLDAQSVAAHYWDTAGKEGWKAVGTRAQAPKRLRSGFGMCFQKEVAGQPALLRVGADGPREYVVTVESALDGSTIAC